MKKGFTLMEILVSMSIFAIFTLAALSIHSAVLHNSQKSIAYNRIQQEAQIITESLSKKIRTSRVDYNYSGYSGGIGDIEDELALVDLSSNYYVFYLDTGDIKIKTKSAGEVNYSDGVPVPSSNVSISSLSFIIEPTSSPFSIDAPPSTQPRVTMVIEFSAQKGRQNVSLIVQQTVPQLSGGIIE